MAVNTIQNKRQMQEQAIAASDGVVREVYRIQQKRAELGEIPYDPQRQVRVVFQPETKGGYTAVLRPVVLSSIKDAQEAGADYWDVNRGWILHGLKPVSEFGQFVRPVREDEPAASEE